MTLIEVALMIVIIGAALTAIVEFVSSATRTNQAISDRPIGIAIARAGHEWARAQSSQDLMDHFFVDNSAPGAYTPYIPTNPAVLDVHSTAADAQPLAMTADVQKAYQNWSQKFSIRRVKVNAPTTTDIETDPALKSPAVELTVTAMKDGTAVCSLKRLYYTE